MSILKGDDGAPERKSRKGPSSSFTPLKETPLHLLPVAKKSTEKHERNFWEKMA